MNASLPPCPLPILPTGEFIAYRTKYPGYCALSRLPFSAQTLVAYYRATKSAYLLFNYMPKGSDYWRRPGTPVCAFLAGIQQTVARVEGRQIPVDGPDHHSAILAALEFADAECRRLKRPFIELHTMDWPAFFSSS